MQNLFYSTKITLTSKTHNSNTGKINYTQSQLCKYDAKRIKMFNYIL